MKYDNEVGYKSLNLYANKEHVEVSKELLLQIIKQILKNCKKDCLDEFDVDCTVNDHAVAGLLLLFMEVASDAGYIKLVHDLQYLAINYDLSHLL
jgi:hypothetical protein